MNGHMIVKFTTSDVSKTQWENRKRLLPSSGTILNYYWLLTADERTKRYLSLPLLTYFDSIHNHTQIWVHINNKNT